MISLEKGGNAVISLDKENPLKSVHVGCGWKVARSGEGFDLDITVFAVGADDKVASDADFIFYGHKEGADGAIVHCGDNKTGEGEGDDELIGINLEALPARVEKIVFCVSIHKATERGQNFGMVGDAYVRLLDPASQKEVIRYDLADTYGTSKSVVLGEVYRKNGDWKFRALGQGMPEELAQICAIYGVQVG